MSNQTAFFAMLAFVAFLIGLSKGGLGGTLGALAAPLMALVMPADKALGLLMPLLMLGDIFALVFYWRKWNARLAMWLIPAAVVGVILGTVVITNAPTALLETILGIVILVFVVYKLFEPRILSALSYQQRNWHGLVAGSIAGLASTLAHNGGPPISIYLLMQKLTPVVFVGTSAIFFFALNWIKVPFYIYAGVFDLGLMRNLIWVLPMLVAGVFAGKWMAVRISRVWFERIIIVLLALTALLLIFKPGKPAPAAPESASSQTLPVHSVLRLGDPDAAASLATTEAGVRPSGPKAIAVAVAPDGKLIASGLDNEIRIWDAGSGALNQTLAGHDRLVGALAFAPDGRTLASGGWDGRVILWDPKKGRQLRELAGHTKDIATLAWSPDGTRLAASGSLDNEVIIWDAKSGEVLTTLEGTDSGVWGLAWSPDGSKLAAGTTLAEILLWDVHERGVPAKAYDTLRAHVDWVTSLAWSPDSTKLVSGSADRLVIVWDMVNRQRFQNLTGHDNVVRAVAFSPDGTKVATAGLDGRVIVWPVAEKVNEPLEVFLGHDQAVDALAWLPGSERLASASEDGTVLVWELQDSR